ncbi:MAG: hypothetical protein AAFS12_03160, partial [Cyanobacteria bacterium J06632_19]
DDKTEFELTGNNISENTRFKKAVEGEIESIGFDNNDTIDDGANFFQVSGTQDWGIELEEDYTIGSESQTYEVKVGEYDMSGNFNYLTLANDHDVSNPNAQSHFGNIS